MYEKTTKKIWEAFNDYKGAQILKGRKMSLVKCPKCGSTYAHFSITELTEKEIGTRQGGYLLKVEYECDCCPPFMTVIAEHKGEMVIGQIISTE